MTTFTVPPAGSPAWRQIHLTPPNAPLYTIGPYCPLDDTVLRARRDGYGCPVCCAAWDFHGLAGRWLPEVPVVPEPVVRWRPSTALMLSILAGSAFAAAGVVMLADMLDPRLLWWLIAALAAAAVVIVAYALGCRVAAWWPYRHNRIIAVHHGRELPAGTGQVPGEC